MTGITSKGSVVISTRTRRDQASFPSTAFFWRQRRRERERKEKKTIKILHISNSTQKDALRGRGRCYVEGSGVEWNGVEWSGVEWSVVSCSYLNEVIHMSSLCKIQYLMCSLCSL